MSLIHWTIAPLLVIALLSAQKTSTKEQNCDQKTAEKLELSISDTTILGLTIGKSSLSDVQAKLGATALLPRKEHADDSICYISPVDGTVIVFAAGAMGGWSDLTEFALWSREASFPHKGSCAKSTLVTQAAATDSGIRLGLSTEALSKILGKPAKMNKVSIKYESACRKRMTERQVETFKAAKEWNPSDETEYNVSSWVTVTLRGSRASRIVVTKIEST
jgi:hypothetical protein